MKKLIFKKLGKDIGAFFLISIICLTTIVWIIQAVNYLDLISEDGHSLSVYFSYTLFNLPKIISRLLPFIFALSLFYTLLRYELNNELVIYWMNGISKNNIIHSILRISIFYFFVQIVLTSYIVPESLDKGRSYFRNSNVDLFTSIIKKKKFIDSVEDLTIFVDNKKNDNLFSIIIKEKMSDDESQIIIAQEGRIVNESNSNKIILINGKIINTKQNNQNIIDFSEFILDLSNYNSNTISHPKTQEMSSKNLFKCLKKINENKKYQETKKFFMGCNMEIKKSIIEEFLKRFFGPIFIILIGLTISLMVFINKDQNKYRIKSSSIFIMSIILILISEITLRYSSLKISNMFIYTSIPISLFIALYSYITLIQKYKR